MTDDPKKYTVGHLLETTNAPVAVDPKTTNPEPAFLLQIDESTTLGQLQVVIAAFGIDMRWYFFEGKYVVKAFSFEARGDGRGDTLAQAIKEAILQIRGRTAVVIIGSGSPYR